MNIIILGGSMTHGATTMSACRCSDEIDSSCPEAIVPSQETHCSWPTFFTNWVQKHLTWASITVYDFSRSGLTSKMMAELYGDFLREKLPGAKLTSNDIVIMDHSVNDNNIHPLIIQHGTELLVRRVLHSAEGARPTIIMIEQYPHAIGFKGPYGEVNKLTDCATTYRAVSQHYGLLLWSVREVFWTYFNLTTVGVAATSELKVRMYPLDPTLPEIHRDTHPPWYIHKFVADLLADCLLRVMSLMTNKTSDLYSHSAIGTEGNAPPPYELPPPLMDVSKLGASVCDMKAPFLVDAHASATFKPANLHEYETNISIVSQEGWREYIDHHDVPGWMINSLNDPEKRRISFPIADSPTGYVNKRIKITYLKSYTGMGTARVMLCGEYIYEESNIDALFHDHDTFHVSVPEVYMLQVSGGDGQRCSALPAAERSLAIDYTDIGDGSFAPIRKKNHSKFKFMSVQMCTDKQEV